jgi:mitotic spindle assembly checkpoint protein MAD1
MNGDQFKTPLNKFRAEGSSLRSTAIKRDSLAAELERGKFRATTQVLDSSLHIDPQLSSAKRQQRTQVFTSSVSHASLERQLLAAQTAKLELETKLREKELLVERLERDRRWFADREKEEREEKERERETHDEAKVRGLISFIFCVKHVYSASPTLTIAPYEPLTLLSKKSLLT